MSKQNQKQKNNKAAPKKRIDPLMLAAIIACAVAVVAMVVVIAIKFTPKKGEFVAPSFDSAAVVGTPEVPDGLGWGEAEAEEFVAMVCGVLNVNDGKADVWLTNPEKNTVWLKLRVMNEQGEILAETGLIRPGEYLQTVTFDTLPQSGDNITMKVMAYEPDTYLSAGAVSLKTVIS